jgi:hypothetical protein
VTAEEESVLARVKQALKAGEHSTAMVSALLDRIEARAYERGRDALMAAVAPITASATAGGPVDQPPEHPLLRKLRLLSLRWSELGGLVTGVDDLPGDPLTWEDLHAYRHEYDAAHQNNAQRPQTGQGGHAAPLDAQGREWPANGGKGR